MEQRLENLTPDELCLDIQFVEGLIRKAEKRKTHQTPWPPETSSYSLLSTRNAG